MRDSFTKTHPLVGLLFYAAVIGCSMFVMQPVCLLISLCCAAANAVYCNGKKTLWFTLKIILPMVILISVINPVFNHRGATILGYFPWENPLTLESILYGIASSVMLSSVFLWFSSFNKVMTSDKFVYLFGKVIPSLSLVLSMSLRFVPRFQQKFREVQTARRLLENEPPSVVGRIKNAVRVLSVMLSWSLESSVETADSMKSRGYGLKGRTSFSLYRFTVRDIGLVILIPVLTGLLIFLLCSGAVDYHYYPVCKGNLSDWPSTAFYLLYAGLMLLPLGINVKEAIAWKLSQSNI